MWKIEQNIIDRKLKTNDRLEKFYKKQENKNKVLVLCSTDKTASKKKSKKMLKKLIGDISGLVFIYVGLGMSQNVLSNKYKQDIIELPEKLLEYRYKYIINEYCPHECITEKNITDLLTEDGLFITPPFLV